MSLIYRERDSDDDAKSSRTSVVSISWRTFSTSSAPSELLSFKRGDIGSITGRFMARFGEAALGPIENVMIRRELKGVLTHLRLLDSREKWDEDGLMLVNDHIMSGRILEALRPMYPQDIRSLANDIIHMLLVFGQFDLSEWIPRLHFYSENEYNTCIAFHTSFLLSKYGKETLLELLPRPKEGCTLLIAIHSALIRSSSSSRSRSLQDPSRSLDAAIQIIKCHPNISKATESYLSQQFTFAFSKLGSVKTLARLEASNTLKVFLDIGSDTNLLVHRKHVSEFLKVAKESSREEILQCILQLDRCDYEAVLDLMSQAPASNKSQNWKWLETKGDMETFAMCLIRRVRRETRGESLGILFHHARHLQEWNKDSKLFLFMQDLLSEDEIDSAAKAMVVWAIGEKTMNKPPTPVLAPLTPVRRRRGYSWGGVIETHSDDW